MGEGAAIKWAGAAPVKMDVKEVPRDCGKGEAGDRRGCVQITPRGKCRRLGPR